MDNVGPKDYRPSIVREFQLGDKEARASMYQSISDGYSRAHISEMMRDIMRSWQRDVCS